MPGRNRPTRRSILIEQRPTDDGVIDIVVIRRALAGWAPAAAELTERELRVAVHLGAAQGMSDWQMSGLLLIYDRLIATYRAEACPREQLHTDPAGLVPELIAA